MSAKIKTACLGFPRIGQKRELKFALEKFWSGKCTEEDLLHTARDLKAKAWAVQHNLDYIPSGDFSFYDGVLDLALEFGVVPRELLGLGLSHLDLYFALARGYQEGKRDIHALEMTKWFDTNYHYIVPNFSSAAHENLKYTPRKLAMDYKVARESGIATRPVILGPVSFLILSKVDKELKKKLFPDLVRCYIDLLLDLIGDGCTDVQLDEPCLACDVDSDILEPVKVAYSEINKLDVQVHLATYFELVEPSVFRELSKLHFSSIHVDLSKLVCAQGAFKPASHDTLSDFLVGVVDKAERARVSLAQALKEAIKAESITVPSVYQEYLDICKESHVSLSLGLVDGRNIWADNLLRSVCVTQLAVDTLGEGKVIVATSCSLALSPYSLKGEDKINPKIKSWLAFASEKVEELEAIAGAFAGPAKDDEIGGRTRLLHAKSKSSMIVNDDVRAKLARLSSADFSRDEEFKARQKKQKEHFGFPLYPTTTIGSFPQTPQIRANRRNFKNGTITQAAYEKFCEGVIAETIKEQEKLGLDVLVHGECERNDMVEYFGEFLEGFAITENGWVQSYGSRCVKPPLIFGDVSRPNPMTVRWIKYAQSLTSRPVKGMLTGPVTIMKWSFVRNDVPLKDVSMQIGVALRDEVHDLEDAGINIIQIDEPAIREALPLKEKNMAEYLRWAVSSFRLSSKAKSSVTQIHTHMCYSEFGDILQDVLKMDADVVSIETSRSQMELLDDFKRFNYVNEIGPGVYDIHSPRIPESTEMYDLLLDAAKVIESRNLWVNPDCGLKTRRWEEVVPALAHMVKAAKRLRHHKE